MPGFNFMEPTMVQTAQIMCINKNNRTDPTERITHVGGVQTSRWKITLDDAIRKIESGEWKFFTSVNGRSVWVEIATSASGRKYLRTEADSRESNNLLSLPECP